MGRPPKSTSKLKLAGTYRDDRHGERGDSEPPLGVPVRPDGLTDEESECWYRHIGQVIANGAGEADTDRLVGLCKWHARYRRYEAELGEKPGDYKLLVMCVTAWKQYEQSASKLGIGPVDRAKLRVPKQEKKKPDGKSRFFQTG